MIFPAQAVSASEIETTGVHKAFTMTVSRPNASDLDKLRLDLPASFRDFGLILKRALDPKARRGFSRSYVFALCQGQREITPEISKAYWLIVSALDDTDPTIALVRSVNVWATNDISGVLITGQAVQCARAGCPVRFIRTSPAQKYHSPYCREQYKAERKTK